MVALLAVLRFVPLSFPASKSGEPRCAVRQPSPEEEEEPKPPVEELDRVIHWMRIKYEEKNIKSEFNVHFLFVKLCPTDCILDLQ